MTTTKYILAVLVLSITSCFVGEQSNGKSNAITQNTLKPAKGKIIAFYNVENLFDTIDNKYTIDEQFLPSSEKQWNSERYFKKLNDLSKVISSFGNDLPIFLGMAEIENKAVIEDLINTEKLKKGNYGIVHEESPDQRGIDLGFIYRKDYAKYISHKNLEVALEDHPDFFTRDILYIQLELAGKDTIHIFLNHWPSRREGQKESEYRRVRAATVLREQVDVIFEKNANAKILIMGDFNDYPPNKSLREVLKAQDNKKLNPGELFNTAYSHEKNNRGTYNYKGDWGMLDQLIISEGFFRNDKGVLIKQSSCSILMEEWMLYTDPKYNEKKPSKTYGGSDYYGGYSDHLPIYMTLE